MTKFCADFVGRQAAKITAMAIVSFALGSPFAAALSLLGVPFGYALGGVAAVFCVLLVQECRRAEALEHANDTREKLIETITARQPVVRFTPSDVN